MAANYILLQSLSLTQSAASITFNNIPQSGYTDLKIVMSSRSTNANVTDDVYLTINGLNTSIYSVKAIQGSGSAASSFSNSGTGLPNTISDGANATANTYGSAEFYIPNYTSSNYKSILIDSVQEDNASAAYSRLLAGLISSTSAISSITLTSTGSFVQYSTFSIYGLAAVGVTPSSAPKAYGGDIIVNDGTYWYHAFLSTGAFTPQTNLTCNALVIAGGGSGGVGNGGGGGAGGGGAGGFLGLTSQSFINATAYTVTVGAGGPAQATGGTALFGVQGNNSQIAALTAAVGGGAGAGVNLDGGGTTGNGGNGGSGGGAAYWDNPARTYYGGTPTSGQGNAGGNAATAGGGRAGGGGGGAGAVGQTGGVAIGGVSGYGGAGLNTYSSWATATGTGVSGYYAGGGGGSSAYGGAAGGSGGGGTSVTPDSTTVNQASGSGVANTGSGGGGIGGNSGVVKISGAGGSGIVIIRYAMA